MFPSSLVTPSSLKPAQPSGADPIERRRHTGGPFEDPAERDALYGEFQPLVRRLIRQYGHCPEMRQDLAGEIYCRFCALLEAYDPSRGIPVRPYLVRQLTASVYTFVRAGWRNSRREISLEGNEGITEFGPKEDPSRDWDDQLTQEQMLHALPQAIARLPKRQRQVLIWRYYEDRSFEDIAELLEVQVATARSLLRHAVRGLRISMASHAVDSLF